MQMLYVYFKHNEELSLNKVEKELHFSINKTYDLYHYLLILLIEIRDYASLRIEMAQQKKIPTYYDLHPSTKFIDNKVIAQISINKQLHGFQESMKLNWIKYPELIKGLYNTIIENDEYKIYINADVRSYSEDKNFVSFIYKNIISNYELLFQNLEEQSIYWNDEVEYIIGIIIKTIKKFKEEEGENSKLLPLYKNLTDEEYSKRLLRKVVLNHKEYRELIEKYSKNWDIDRIAFVDILLMEMAIAEVLEFSSIPIKVTLNEYLELSKYYSTPKSSIFINGILDKVFNNLKNDNKIRKQGRGLIGEE